MASESDRTAALISIIPKYVDRILEGIKQIEFRRRGFQKPVKVAVIYASSPLKKIVGFFEIETVEIATPEVLWEKYSDISGIEEVDYKQYFINCTEGYAIQIGKVFRLVDPIALDILCSGLIPPQNFLYLSENIMNNIRRMNYLEENH